MRRGLPIALLLLAAIPSALAQNAIVSERADKVAVTIYNLGGVASSNLMQSRAAEMRREGLAVVNETRSLDLPAGPAVIQLRDVGATMVPQTAAVTGLPEEVDERNFDFNLLSPGSLIQKSIGDTVHVVRTNRQTGIITEEDAVLRSAPDGVVMQIGNRAEALNCSALPERLVFDHIPAGLYDTPTLTVRTNVPRAGRYTIALRYIATGLFWSADYVARIAEDDRSLDLDGWLTLANFSETSFKDAPVDVIAGRPQVTGEDTPTAIPKVVRSDRCWPTKIDWSTHRREMPAPAPPGSYTYGSGGNETVVVTGTSIRGQAPVGANVISVARDFADYKLYQLPTNTTVAAQQTKQVQFLNQPGVAFQRIYRYDNDEGGYVDPRQAAMLPVSIVLRLKNTRAEGLGKPLPSGQISALVSIPDDAPIPVSYEGEVRDTPVGLPLEIPAGSTTDIIAQKTIVDSTAGAGGQGRRTTLEVAVANGKPKAITFEWRQPVYPPWSTLISETRRHEIKNGFVVWTLNLRAGEKIVFRYTLGEQ